MLDDIQSKTIDLVQLDETEETGSIELHLNLANSCGGPEELLLVLG